MPKRSLLPLAAAALLGSGLPAWSDDPFPDGPGKETVVAVCGGCHDIGRIRIGYTPEGWHTVMRMMQNFGAPVPDDQWATVERYLVEHFPSGRGPRRW